MSTAAQEAAPGVVEDEPLQWWDGDPEVVARALLGLLDEDEPVVESAGPRP